MIKTLNESVRTGIAEIDQQHEALLKIINRLNQDIKEQDEVWEILIAIENYIHNHFSAEEKYMRSFNYQDFAKHKLLHEKFAEEYKEISTEITGYNSGLKTLPSLKAFIELWVKTHYEEADKKLALFLKEKTRNSLENPNQKHPLV